MKKNSKPLFWLAFVIYLVLLIKMMLIRLPISEIKTSLGALSFDVFFSRIKHAQYIPFKTILHHYNHSTMKVMVTSIGWIMLWMIPLGFFLPLLTKKRKYINVLIIGLLIGMVIEILQLILGTGGLNVDDIILTGIGVSIGFSIYKIQK